MNGADLLSNLIDELNRAREFIKETSKISCVVLDECIELINDIDSDLDRVYEYKDSLDAVLEDIEID